MTSSVGHNLHWISWFRPCRPVRSLAVAYRKCGRSLHCQNTVIMGSACQFGCGREQNPRLNRTTNGAGGTLCGIRCKREKQDTSQIGINRIGRFPETFAQVRGGSASQRELTFTLPRTQFLSAPQQGPLRAPYCISFAAPYSSASNALRFVAKA